MHLMENGRSPVKSIALCVAACIAFSCKTVGEPPAATVLESSGQGDGGNGLTSDQRTQYARYLNDTIASFEMMRGKTGLVKDSVWICWDRDLKGNNFKDTEQLTSPTNIGLDLVLLTQRILEGGAGSEDAADVKDILNKLLKTLSTIPYNHATGLFFRTYWPDTGIPFDVHLSSVDNLHLAYGLWTTAEAFAQVDAGISATAKKLFDRMDFSAFYNETTGLIGGNLRPDDEDLPKRNRGSQQGTYIRDKFDYKYFGSEARSLYALGWALGLYKKASRDIRDFDKKLLGPGIDGTIAEVATLRTAGGNLDLLRTWDGGGFQALLPGVLIREELYSPILGKLHENYAKRLLHDADRLGVPAAHSASAFGIRGLRMFRTGDKNYDESLPIYNGAAGHIDMVATIHEDVNHPDVRRFWDIAYTPHPAFMAASFAREPALAKKFAETFKANEAISSVSTCVCGQEEGSTEKVFPAPSCVCRSKADLPNVPMGPDGIIGEPNLCTVASAADAPSVSSTDRMYQPGLGWMDGYYVKGPLKDRVVPVLISLDQGMIALSIFSILSTDGHHVGSKSLSENPAIEARLRRAYEAINDKLAALPKG